MYVEGCLMFNWHTDTVFCSNPIILQIVDCLNREKFPIGPDTETARVTCVQVVPLLRHVIRERSGYFE